MPQNSGDAYGYLLPHSTWSHTDLTLRTDWLMTGSFVEKCEKKRGSFNDADNCEDYTSSVVYELSTRTEH
jgi:hypothetical protein